MGANGRSFRLGRTGTAGVLATGLLAATAAGAAILPTGHMLAPQPAGPTSEDLPASTSSGPYRIPSAFAYGLVGSRLAAVNRPGIVRISGESPQPSLREAPGVVHLNSVPKHPATAEGTTNLTAKTAVEPTGGPFAKVCPVALRDQRKSVTPKPRFSSFFEGQCYYFSSAAAKAKFDAKPERYAPAYGGQDIVLIARGERTTTGSLQHAGFYHKRLYLFESAETARVFQENPAKFVGR